MSGIRTGDWGARWPNKEAHCWKGVVTGKRTTAWVAMCDDQDEFVSGFNPGLVPGNGEVCPACREIVERATREIPS